MPKPKRLKKEGKHHHLDIIKSILEIDDEVILYALDLAKWLSGYVKAKGNLLTGEIALLDWQLFVIDKKSEYLKDIQPGQQYPLIAEILKRKINHNYLIGLPSNNEFLAIETVFLGQNPQSMIDTAMIRGAICNWLEAWYYCGRAYDIAPTLMKKRATANTEHPFGSGNGQSKKHVVAEAMREKFNLSPEQFQDMTTLERPRSTKTVYDVTDALALAYTLFVELRHHKGYI